MTDEDLMTEDDVICERTFNVKKFPLSKTHRITLAFNEVESANKYPKLRKQTRTTEFSIDLFDNASFAASLSNTRQGLVREKYLRNMV